MNIAPNGLSRFVDAKADERDLETIAQEAQRVQNDPLLTVGTGENVVYLVDDQTRTPIASIIRNAACSI